jgi:hypothetical protein
VHDRLAAQEYEGPVSRLRSGAVVRSWPVPPFRIYHQRRPGEMLIVRVSPDASAHHPIVAARRQAKCSCDATAMALTWGMLGSSIRTWKVPNFALGPAGEVADVDDKNMRRRRSRRHNFRSLRRPHDCASHWDQLTCGTDRSVPTGIKYSTLLPFAHASLLPRTHPPRPSLSPQSRPSLPPLLR